MAHTGFCDSRALLDLDNKAEERSVPVRTWASACPPKERWALVEGFGPVGTFLNAEKHCIRVDGLLNSPGDYFAGFPVSSAHTSAVPPFMLVPGLLRHEMEIAMVSLGVIHDRTYAWDIFTDMLWSQLKHTFPSAELPKPYSEKMLAILIDWLIQVHAVLDFSEETLHLTVFLLNRAVRLLKVPVTSLQLLGVVCLFLASKKEECLIPEVSELCHLMENTYTKLQLLKMERRVLCVLKFELSYTSPHHFLLLLTTIDRCSNKMVWMARYLLELTLLELECVVYQPIQLAGAAIQLARCVLQEPPVSYISHSIFVGSEANLLPIMKTLSLAAARAPISNTRATFLKYSSEETMCVSKHPALICAVGLLKMP